MTNEEVIKKIDEKLGEYALKVIDENDLNKEDIEMLFIIRDKLNKDYAEKMIDKLMDLNSGFSCNTFLPKQVEGDEDVQQQSV